MADNPQFFNDLREPHMGADLSTVTLSTTSKALHPLSNFPLLGSQYFARVGKKLHIRAVGKITTGGTPGNLTLELRYGTGADANGTIVVTSAAVVLIVNQTDIPWWIDIYVRCTTIGSAGALYALGKAHFGAAVIATTAQPIMMPASAPAAVGSLDLTSSSSILSLQAKRSGSTGETMTVQDFDVISLN